MTQATAPDGCTVELVDIEMTPGHPNPDQTADDWLERPDHDGQWLIVRSSSRRILRWIPVDDKAAVRLAATLPDADQWVDGEVIA